MKSILTAAAILFAFQTFAAVFSTIAECRKIYVSSGDSIQRRRAFLRLTADKSTANEYILKGLSDKDAAIRKKAVYELFQIKGDAGIDLYVKMASDPDDKVAELAVECVSRLKDKKNADKLLAKIANEVKNQAASRCAAAKTFRFHRKNVRLSERKDWDFEIVKVKTLPVPVSNMRFTADRGVSGHLQGFFNEKFDDRAWKPQKIGYWRYQGFNGFVGIGWYRIKFKMPAKIVSNAVELNFNGVESSAWIWLNGIYVGSRDEGPNAWTKPFSMDVTKEIRWDAENMLVVRVKTNNTDGGIYKPVFIDILK